VTSPGNPCRSASNSSSKGETIDFKGVGTTPDGNRWNDLHYTNAVKLAARKGG